jgi:hypothetical protein
MHRISARQDALLKELHEITSRIERISQAEHDLIRDVHPKVHEIKEHVENVAEAVSPQNSAAPMMHHLERCRGEDRLFARTRSEA